MILNREDSIYAATKLMKYFKDFKIEGCSNFAFPIFTKRDNLQQIKDKLKELRIE